MALISTSPVAAADAARSARVAGRDPTASRPGAAAVAQPTAADPLDPAVVNHVRGAAGQVQAGAAKGGSSAGDKAAGGQSTEQSDKAREQQISKLAKRDADVRAHEQAHAAAGGGFAGAPSYTYQRGPDGRNYAVGGEVPIDVSPISGDPEATIQKMQQVKRAALAPIDPSDADRAIASTADAQIAAAQQKRLAGKSQEAAGAESSGAATTSPAQREASATGAAAREVFGSFQRRHAAAGGYAAARGEGRIDQVA